MAEIEIGDALASGFGLIRREPLAVLLWGLLYLAASVAAIAVFGPVYVGFLGQVLSQAANPGVPPNVAAFSQQIVRMQGLGMLVNLGMAFVGVVIYCAVFRAVLRPEQKRFGYLRVGSAELFLFLLMVGGYIVIGVGMVVVVLLVALVVAILAAGHAVAAAVVVAVLAAIAIAAGLIYLLIRFSLLGPMMVHDGKFHLFESWTATRGRTLSLFIVGVCLVMILLIAEFVIATVFFLIGVGVLASAAGGLGNLPAFFHQPPQTLLSRLGPMLAIGALVWAPVAGCLMAIVAAPWARAYQDIVGPDVATEFA